ncbi:MAG: hypothetical protein ABSE05_13835 [Syntrophales bacterium]
MVRLCAICFGHQAGRERPFPQNQDLYDLNFFSASKAVKILALNCGSSSLKYSLFDTVQALLLLEGEIEKIGSGDAIHKVYSPGQTEKMIKRTS